jgi:hypothetical protein
VGFVRGVAFFSVWSVVVDVDVDGEGCAVGGSEREEDIWSWMAGESSLEEDTVFGMVIDFFSCALYF